MRRAHVAGALVLAWLVGGSTADAAEQDDGDRNSENLINSTLEAGVRSVWEQEPILGKGLSLYKPNYFMPFTWTDKIDRDDDTEVQFQISFKQRIGHTHVFFAYTQVSFWRMWDSSDSRPFRETNFNPEMFYRWRAEKHPFGPLDIDFGLEHESNGQSLPDSRSWNRAYIRPIYMTRDWRVQLKLWARIFDPDEPSTVDNPDGDDNPDIIDFMGNHELQIDWRFSEGRQLSLMNRYNFDKGKGALRLRYFEPTTADGIHWFVQAFHGYGESLIDYNREISRLGIGVAISH